MEEITGSPCIYTTTLRYTHLTRYLTRNTRARSCGVSEPRGPGANEDGRELLYKKMKKKPYYIACYIQLPATLPVLPPPPYREP